MGFFLKNNTTWRLEVADEDSAFLDATFEAQFEAQDLTVDRVGGQIAEATTVNREHPIAQWIAGLSERVTFTGRLWAKHALDDIKERLDELLKFTWRIEELKRPPICIFSIGPQFDLQCLVETISNIRFDSFRSDGSIRGVTFSVTLVRYTLFGIKKTDPTAKEPSTRHYIARQGDTFESIAKREYGDALFGVNLRRLHPELSLRLNEIQPGDIIRILPKEHSLIRKKIEPEYHGFRDSPEAKEARQEIFSERGMNG